MKLTEALNILRHYQLWRLGEEISMLEPKVITEAINVVISGAKWQQDKMYSEEEVKKLSTEFFYHWYNAKGNNTEEGFDKWFEQFKKQ